MGGVDRILAELLSPQRLRGGPRAVPGLCLPEERSGGQGSPPESSSPPLSRSSRLRGARARTHTGRPDTHGARNRSAAVAETYSSGGRPPVHNQLVGSGLGNPAGRRRKVTSQPQGATATAPAKGARMGSGSLARWSPRADRRGLTTPRSRTLCLPPASSPRRALGREEESAAAGAAEGGGPNARGRELERAVCWRPPGVSTRSLQRLAAPPPLRLPEQSAPGGPAPGYKRADGEGGRGGRERARRQKVTPGEGGRERVKAAGGGGRRRKGREERVGGVNRERKRGRGLWQVERETKRSAESQPRAAAAFGNRE